MARAALKTKPFVSDNQLRRLAIRRGFQLVKSRTRDPRGIDYDRFALIDVATNQAVKPPLGRFICSMTRDEVAQHLGA